ncbi:MAG: hypothetical protein N2037_06785 [Acidimicrobiales bacterium]|nr:hypothetical protein [Acidimicrobiales bacterium]
MDTVNNGAQAGVSRMMRRRTIVGATIVTMLGVAACGGASKVSTGGEGQQAASATNDAEALDPAALASLVHQLKPTGDENSTTTLTTVPPPVTVSTTAITAPPLTVTTTAPPTTQPPQTVPPPRDTRTPPTPATGLTADETKVVTFVNNYAGKSFQPEVALMNTARSGSKNYTGPVSYRTWVYAEVSGPGSIENLMSSLAAQGRLASFATPGVDYIGVGILSVSTGLRIVVFGAAF